MAFVDAKTADVSEAAIQDALARELLFQKKHAAVVPNTYLYGFETDLVSVTRTGFVYGFEIKVSRSDFASEFVGPCKSDVKTWRLEMLTGARAAPDRIYHTGRHRLFDVPSYFSIVVPDGIVERDEIPDQFGVFRFSPRGRIEQLRAPRIIHRRKISHKEAARLSHAFAVKYWRMRFSHGSSGSL